MKYVYIIIFLFIVFSCEPTRTWTSIEPFNDKLILSLRFLNNKTYIYAKTFNHYRLADKIIYNIENIDKTLTINISGMEITHYPMGTFYLFTEWHPILDIIINDLTSDTYYVKFIYNASTDIYDLTVDSIKYEMFPMSSSFTYFENTSDMVLFK